MKYLATLLIIVTTFLNGVAQQQQQIKQAAELMAKATLKGDYKTLAKYTHPKVVKMMGGREKMVTILSSAINQMKSQGITFEDATVGDPQKIITVGTELYTVLPQRIVMKVNGQTISNASTLLANSSDKGKTWYFTDAGGMTDQQIKQLFPGVLGKLTINKRTTPVNLN